MSKITIFAIILTLCFASIEIDPMIEIETLGDYSDWLKSAYTAVGGTDQGIYAYQGLLDGISEWNNKNTDN